MCRTIVSLALAAVAVISLAHCCVRADDAPATLVPLEQLTEKLEKSIDGRIDIDLKSGKSYLRCKLLRVTAGDKNGPPKAHQISGR